MTDSDSNYLYIYIILFQLPIALPFILCIISFMIVALTFYQKTKESLMALGIVAFGLFTYIICVVWKDKPKFIQEKMCKVLYSFQIIRDFTKNIFGLVDPYQQHLSLVYNFQCKFPIP